MKFSTKILAASVAVFLALGLGVVLYLQRAPQLLTENLPTPNGFDELVQVETAWQSTTNASAHRELLPKLRSGLSKESQMPLAIVRLAFVNPPTQSVSSKILILGLISLAEAELAAGRGTEAVQLWSDALLFGPARCRGGAAIHLMVGIGGEKRILESVEAHRDRLSPDDRRRLAATLRLLDSRWEPAAVVFHRDLTLGLEQVPESQRLMQRLAVAFLGSLKKVEEKTGAKLEAAAVRRASLVRDLER